MCKYKNINCLIFKNKYNNFFFKEYYNMSNKISFSAFGRDSYYHRDWFKKMVSNLIVVQENGL